MSDIVYTSPKNKSLEAELRSDLAEPGQTSSNKSLEAELPNFYLPKQGCFNKE